MHKNCLVCRVGTSGIAALANDNALPTLGTRFLPDWNVLGCPSSVNRLAMSYRAKELPRRKILDFVSDHVPLHGGSIIWGDRSVRLKNINVDDLFGLDDSERWISSFLNFAIETPRQQAQNRVMVRLTLLWAALAIHNPEQARLVIR